MKLNYCLLVSQIWLILLFSTKNNLVSIANFPEMQHKEVKTEFSTIATQKKSELNLLDVNDAMDKNNSIITQLNNCIADMNNPKTPEKMNNSLMINDLSSVGDSPSRKRVLNSDMSKPDTSVNSIITSFSNFTDDSRSEFKKYAVNTESEICSDVGARILKNGGSVTDAAIASAICIGVINSFSAGIGGGGFLLVKQKNKNSEDDFVMLDFREVAPENVEIDHFQKFPSDATKGLKSVCTPGEILGFYEAHKRFGKVSWKKLFEESIDICFNGFRATPILVQKLEKNKSDILSDPGMREIFTINGEIIPVGHLVVRKNLGATLKEISEDPMSFYTGNIARKIVEYSEANGGYLTLNDLKLYEVKERSVLKGRFNSFDVYTTNLPTSGLFVIQALNILDHFDTNKLKKLIGKDNIAYIYHILIEVFKFMYSERSQVGDPDFVENWKLKVSKIITKVAAHDIFTKLDFQNVLNTTEYDMKSPFAEDHGTTHLNVVDEFNNVALLTTTINLEFGSKKMDPATGIIFNNHISDFSIPNIMGFNDVHNNDGLSNANILEPWKRPFSSASPVILIKNNSSLDIDVKSEQNADDCSELLVIGAAGGTRIPTSVVATIFYNALGISLFHSISATRIHNQLYPEHTFVERNFPSDLMEQLEQFGHKFEVSDQNTTFTSVQGIHIINNNGQRNIYAISDPRKHGKSAGL